MANIDTHAPGSFCWIELGTTDQNGAKKFYNELFGWTANDTPMSPGEVYTLFNLQGRNTGGGYTLRPDMVSAGVPPHWMLYIGVEDADATAAKVAPAGGKVEAGPFDVMDLGRMAVLQDSAGAMVSIWQPKSHHGIGIQQVPGTLCWADLITPDPAAASRFYSAVFGWELDPGQDGSGYLHIKNGSEHIGGIPPAAYRDPRTPPHWLLYFVAPDCDAATEKARAAGAKVYLPPMSMEKVGRWSVIADPQGAVLALFQPER